MNKNYFRQTKAFSLLEILIYTAIVGTVTTFLGGVLVSVTKIQSRTSASVEVNQQLNFVLNTVQRLVGESSVVEIPNGAATSTLVLRMPPSSSDPTSIYLQNNTIYLKQGTATATPLTSDQVTVNKLEFLKTSQYPGHDSVQVDLAVSYNTQNPELSFSKTLSSAIARVSAATFDSDIIPGVDNTYDIGLGTTRWQDMSLSGNLLVGGNVGVGTANPGYKLSVDDSSATAIDTLSLENTNFSQPSGQTTGLRFKSYDQLGAIRVIRTGPDYGTDMSLLVANSTSGALTERLRIAEGGNVGIGTTNPASDAAWASPGLDISGTRGTAILRTTGASGIATLRMTGPDVSNNDNWHINMYAGAASTLQFSPKAGGGTTGLVLKNDGNVGIGTTNPASKLDVNGTTQMTGFKMPTGASNNYVLTSDASGTGTWQVASGGGGGGGGGEGAVHGSGAANYVAKWTDSSNIGNSQIFDDGSKVSVTGNVAVGGGMGGTTGKYLELPSTVNDFIRISGEYTNPDTSNGYFVSGDNAGDGWYFQNVDCCGAGTLNYMRIARGEFWYNGTGNFGIGTTNPQGRLHIASGSGPELMFDNAAEIQAKNTSGTPEGFLWPRWNDNKTYLNYGGNGFNIRNNSEVSTMFMGNGGNVGIGSTNPVAKLHISAGDSSLAYFGPNTIWDGRLYVGASPNVSGTKIAQVISTDGNLHLDNANAKTMYLNYYQSGNIIMANAGGNVGIGMSPGYRLDVNGQFRTTDIYLTDGVKIEGLSGRNYFRDAEGAGDLRVGAAWGMPGVYAESGAGVLGGAGGASLQNNSLFVTTSGKVGIGTTNPGYLPNMDNVIDSELHITGDVRVDGYIGGATYGFGGLFQVDDCGVNNSYPNWITANYNCPAGFTARQYGRIRAPESNCGANQYVCLKVFRLGLP